MGNSLPNANKFNYWKSSTSSSDAWMIKSERLIEAHGGHVRLKATGGNGDNKLLIMEFVLGGDTFRAAWPVLPHDQKDQLAAERQAATLVYHDIKYRCLKVARFGYRTAFFDMLLLPGGITAAEASTDELTKSMPRLLMGGSYE